MKRPIDASVRGLTAVFILSWSIGLADVPEGFEVYDGLKDQFTLALTAGWSAYDQNQALNGRSGPHGVIVFSAQPLTKEGGTTADPDMMSRADTGDLPSFFVDRQKAPKSTSCTKISKMEAYNLGVILAKDPIFGTAPNLLGTRPIKHDEIEIGGCRGLRYKGEGKKGEWILDVRVVSDGKVLYLFSLRNKAGNYARNIDTFDKAIGTLKLTQTE